MTGANGAIRLTDEQLDARVRTYLDYRAELVAARATPAREVADVLARRLGLARGRAGSWSTTRLVLAVLLLILALIATAIVGGLFRAHYAPNRPLLEVPLDGQPWAVTAAYGSIWVGAYRAPVVYRLDPADGTVRNDIPVVGITCGTIESGYGALWISHCDPNALSRIDAASLDVDRLVGYATDQVGIGANSVWAAHGDTVARLDPVSLETQAEIPVGGPWSLVVYGEGGAWAAVPDAGVVRRIDPVTNTVSATITFDDVPAGTAYPVHLATGGGAIWVVDERALAVYRIDPRTNTARRLDVRLEPYEGTGFGDWYLRFGRGLMWVRQNETTIAGIDPGTLAIVETHDTPRGGGGGFFVAEDSLWIGNNRAGTLWGMQLP